MGMMKTMMAGPRLSSRRARGCTARAVPRSERMPMPQPARRGPSRPMRGMPPRHAVAPAVDARHAAVAGPLGGGRCRRRCRRRWVRRPACPASRPASPRRRAAAATRDAPLPVVRQRCPADVPVLRHVRLPHGRGARRPRRCRCRRPGRRWRTGRAPQRARLSMTLIRPDGTEGGTHDLRPGENKLGRSFGPVFENDGYLSPVHAHARHPRPARGRARPRLAQRRVREDDRRGGAAVGQIIRIGQELLRFELIAAPEPTADGTELMGSPNPGYWGKLTVIIGREVTGAAFPLLGESVHARPRARRDQLPRRRLRLGPARARHAARRPRVPRRPRQLERHVHQGQRRARRRPRLVRAARPAAVPAELRRERATARR